MVDYILPEKGEKPCILQIRGRGDIGQRIRVNIEVFACDDVAISAWSEVPGSLPGIDAKEFMQKLKETFEICGCEVD